MFALITINLVILGLSEVYSQTVLTKYGPVEGKTISLCNGEEVDIFLGVPYAAPPVGENRFAPPKEVEPWTELLETKNFQKGCVQTVDPNLKKIAWFYAETPESEDCLYLNIWRPHYCEGNKPLAVMLWIHGGGFLAGSSSLPLYDGSILASENDVIVVSINYRLGPFGYLYLNNSVVNGNMGIQDQIQAMRWVSENIENFGGDPNRVTIFGSSAGSASISYHLLNPNIQELFNNAIMESGTVNENYLTHTMEKALKTSLGLGENVGCPIDDTSKLLKCLRDIPTEDITKGNFGPRPYLRLIFAPVRNNIEVPLNCFKSPPKTKGKDVITGNAAQEASYILPSLFPGKLPTDDFHVTRNELRVFLKNFIGLSDETFQDVILHEYINFFESYNYSQLRKEATDLLGDTLLLCPTINFIKYWSADYNQVYHYVFRFQASKPLKATLPEWMGCIHGSEIPFVFGLPLDPNNEYTEEEEIMSKTLMALWTNFAKNGNPNGSGEEIWPPVDTKPGLVHLVIDEKLQAKRFFKESECEFFNNILPKLLSAQEQLKKSVRSDL